MIFSDLLLTILFSVVSLFMLYATIISYAENEKRAGNILALTTLILLIGEILKILFFPSTEILNDILLFSAAIIIALLFFPYRGKVKPAEKPQKRINEADVVLSRRLLNEGTEEYKSYYQKHPRFKLADDKSRNNAGLLSNKSKQYDPVSFAAAKATFHLTDHLHAMEKLPSEKEKISLSPKAIARFIEKWMKQSGAHSIGFTPLLEHQIYSYKGRGERKGEKLRADFPHAIALTVEMNHHMMQFAPAGPTVMESAQQYLTSGILATQLTAFIKSLGFNAKAHIDGNYEVICPLVAADAGLGVIGRMGLLMTPKLGPRVRLAVVTTDLPLSYKQKKSDPTVIDFCERCKKCADVCPVGAIPRDKMSEIDGVMRWQINSERCYNYWTTSGTDCGKCMITCPYSHPNNLFHNFIRWATKNNLLFRIMAVKLDDLIYGRKPKNHDVSGWLNLKPGK